MKRTDYLTLNNGVQMPAIGYGTYQTPPSITEQCVSNALRIGCRSIDTAQCCGNEHEAGLPEVWYQAGRAVYHNKTVGRPEVF